MASVHRSSHSSPSPSYILLAHDNSCFSRTNKIALAIFASLVGFFLLSFNMALALSSLVTLAAVAYCPENNPLIIRPMPLRNEEERVVDIEEMSSSEEEEEPIERNSMAPSSIEIIDTECFNVPPNTVTLRFNSAEALENFKELQQDNLSEIATITQQQGESKSINIVLYSSAINKGVTVDRIISILKEAFGDNLPLIAEAVD